MATRWAEGWSPRHEKKKTRPRQWQDKTLYKRRVMNEIFDTTIQTTRQDRKTTQKTRQFKKQDKNETRQDNTKDSTKDKRPFLIKAYSVIKSTTLIMTVGRFRAYIYPVKAMHTRYMTVFSTHDIWRYLGYTYIEWRRYTHTIYDGV